MNLFQSNEERDREEAKALIISKMQKFNDSDKMIRIYHNVPSSKNSKKIISLYTKYSECCGALVEGKGKESRCTKCGRKKGEKCITCGREFFARKKVPSITHNDTTKRFIEDTVDQWHSNKDKWLRLSEGLTSPIFVGLYFLRKTEAGWDFNNISQILQDLMKNYGWIPEDNTKHLIPVYLGEIKSSTKPGVGIIALPDSYYNSLPELMEYYEKKMDG